MQHDAMKYFNLAKEFKNAGYFESEHHKSLFNDVKEAIKNGNIIAISGLVGSGKTTFLKKVQDSLAKEKEILISKSLSIDKERVKIPTLITALFYDLSTEKTLNIPAQSEKRIRKLRDIIKKINKTVCLFIDEAHDLHWKTLTGLKRLMEVIQDGGGNISIVLAGHPKIKNDLLKPSLEEIGSRSIIFNFDGITASKRDYIEWIIKKCSKPGTKTENIFSMEAIDLFADRLVTPLQFEHYLSLAVDEAFKIGVKPVSQEITESIISKAINDLESRLTRYGYNVKVLSDTLNVKPSVIKSLYKKQLPPAKIQELQNEMLSVGIPV